MASISVYRQSANSTLRENVADLHSRRRSYAASTTFAFKSSFLGKRPLFLHSARKTLARPGLGSADYSHSNPITASCHTFDVVIIGAGIIGLTIARQLLVGSDLSVAVVDKAVPCSGATGAGKSLFILR